MKNFRYVIIAKRLRFHREYVFPEALIFSIGFGAKNVFFIGIGGVSMSGLAFLLSDNGFNVSGSDKNPPENLEAFARRGIPVFVGHRRENVPAQTELAVFTAAVPEGNPELVRARETGVKVVSRAELLGEVIKNYKTSVAVAGCHGKTTTTALCAAALLNYNPTVLLGASHALLNGNIRIGSRELVIFEACEYRDSFLACRPDYAVILNIDADHLDYFTDIDHIRRSFKTFALNARRGVIINADIPRFGEIIENAQTPAVTCAVSGEAANFSARNINASADNISFDIYENGVFGAAARLNLLGRVNAQNALAAYAVCLTAQEGVLRQEILNGFAEFTPVNRRLQRLGSYNGALILDDYAHHPTEITSALSAAANLGKKRVFCLFQPHTYSRTKALFGGFAAAFGGADEVGIVDIYAAREADTGLASPSDLARAINENGKRAVYLGDLRAAAEYYARRLGEGDLLITMGAGDVNKAAEMLIKRKQGDLN